MRAEFAQERNSTLETDQRQEGAFEVFLERVNVCTSTTHRHFSFVPYFLWIADLYKQGNVKQLLADRFSAEERAAEVFANSSS